MPKELFLIVDKPVIHWIAEEAISSAIDTLIFVTGRNKRAIEDYFDNNQKLEMVLRAKGKNAEANRIRIILPNGMNAFLFASRNSWTSFMRFFSERVVGNDPFAVSGKTQLSFMEVDGPDISKYGVIIPGDEQGLVAGLIEN